MTDEPRVDITRVFLSIACIAGLTLASVWTIRPFLGAGIWATMLVVATWPLMLKAQALFGGRRWAAVTTMTLATALILIVPTTLIFMNIAGSAPDVSALAARLSEGNVPQAPEWVAKIPLVGQRFADQWNAAAGTGALADQLRPYAKVVVQWFIARIANVSGAMVQFLLTLGIAATMYAFGESAARGLRAFARRLMGDRGPGTIDLAGQSVRSVALGVVLTAIIQAGLATLGLVVVGVPYTAVLAVITFILCIAMLGPWFVLIPATIWTYNHVGGGWGTAMVVWTLVVGIMDNFLRPWLISRGSNLSLMLVLPGVVGGLISFGLLGVFIGPVLLVVTYTLLEAWVKNDYRIHAAPSAASS